MTSACDDCWPSVRAQHHARIVAGYSVVVLLLGVLLLVVGLATGDGLAQWLDVVIRTMQGRPATYCCMLRPC